jgi:hypothetical protein
MRDPINTLLRQSATRPLNAPAAMVRDATNTALILREPAQRASRRMAANTEQANSSFETPATALRALAGSSG